MVIPKKSSGALDLLLHCNGEDVIHVHENTYIGSTAVHLYAFITLILDGG